MGLHDADAFRWLGDVQQDMRDQAAVKVDTACEAQRVRPPRHGDTETALTILRVSVSLWPAPGVSQTVERLPPRAAAPSGRCEERRALRWSQF